MLDLIKLALLKWQTTTCPRPPQWLPQDRQELFHSQTLIGWDQIIKGRFSTMWLPLISDDSKYALRWLTYAIKQIWSIWFELWKHRCNLNQGTTPNTKQERQKQKLILQVLKLYEESDNIVPNDSYIFKHSQEALLSQAHHDIKKWLRIAKL
jgi:hypothetical protein